MDGEPADTVLELKNRIEAANAEFPADSLRLILAGKVLVDKQTIEELQVTEASFIVCMVAKTAKVNAAGQPPLERCNGKQMRASLCS